MKKIANKIKNWALAFLTEGISPSKLALAVALGVCLGIFPMLGTTSLLCLGAALLLRLNTPAIQAVNYVVYPLQLLLFIPFLKTGSRLFGSDNFRYSLSDITDMLANDLLQTISKLIVVNLQGVLLWLLVCPIIFSVVYYSSLYIFRKINPSIKTATL